MRLPDLLRLPGAEEYREHYSRSLVQRQITTWDGWRVRFYPETFHHAFYTSTCRHAPAKDVFDLSRAERMDWIGALLAAPSVETYRRVVRGKTRRLFLEPTSRYLVVTEVRGQVDERRAVFITAYVVRSLSALAKIRSNPPW